MAAAVDVGSNSVHLLVAIVDGHRIEPLLDESVFLGLGDAVDAEGRFGPTARTSLVEALVHYAELARGLGAARITLVGTEPMRRAADSTAVVAAVSARSGLALHVLGHDEEAYLTVIGVTEGRVVDRETLVVDIGGGSSEFCVIGPSGPPRALGLRLGCARLTARFASGDPPTLGEVRAMTAAASDLLRLAPEAHPAEVVAVGGTASNLLKVLADAPIDRVLTRERVAQATSILAAETAAEAVERHQVRPIRARILPAGAAIVDALMDRYDVARIRVADGGIREGAILVTEQAGGAWRDRLADLAHGWRT